MEADGLLPEGAWHSVSGHLGCECVGVCVCVSVDRLSGPMLESPQAGAGAPILTLSASAQKTEIQKKLVCLTAMMQAISF